ncbi:MAG: hypothetical protein MI861_05940, partial [Pirellulales bacterium]|nr:hypothetical protein [Pirellulales bacterium]
MGMDDRLTTVGHLMGTMPYMAPEQLVDSRDVDPRSDIYSLGATLYRLIAGRTPHSGQGGIAQRVLAITQQDPPGLDSIREDVERNLVALVGQMLSRDPDKRPQDAAEVARRLAEPSQGNAVQRLLKQALRKSSPVDSPHSVQPLAPGMTAPPRSNWRQRIGWAMLGAFFLLGGFVIKVATDRGELTIQSDHSDLVVLVKQGEELVERLQIETGDDNRVTLYKGTYVVEIENAPKGLALDQNVVTIGRGEQVPIEVKEQTDESKAKTAEELRRSLNPTTMQMMMGMDANNSEQAEPKAEVLSSGDGEIGIAASRNSPPADQLLFLGKNLAQWLAILSREQDARSLGNAMRAV